MSGPAARADRRPGALARVLLLGPVVFLLISCSPSPAATSPPAASVSSSPSPSSGAAETQTTLDAVSTAVLQRDRAAFDEQISRRDAAFAPVADRIYDLGEAPLSLLSFRLRPQRHDLAGARRELLGSRAFVQPVAVAWRLTGDTGTAEHLLWLTFLPVGASIEIAGAADGPADRQAQPIWLLQPVAVEQQGRTTVLADPRTPLAQWARRGTAAAAAVERRLSASLDPRWAGDLVLEVPGSGQLFEQVLGVTPGSYAGIAAVAWPEGPDPATAAIRVVVNPEVSDQLDSQGLAVLLVHEAVHVATRSAASPAPTWLVEGLADFVAYQAHPQTAKAAAAALLQQVSERGGPKALPADADFTPTAIDLSSSYAQSWLACRFLAQTYSPARLDRFYREVSSGTAVEQASRSVFGLSLAELTTRWSRYLESAARQR